MSHLTEDQLGGLMRLGWRFRQIGPHEWKWAKFNYAGDRIAIQGDDNWHCDIGLLPGDEIEEDGFVTVEPKINP